MRTKSAQAGQGTIESVLALPVIFCFVTVLGVLLYRGTLYYFADYHLHEALICLDSASVHDCERELSARLKKVLLFRENTKLSLRKGSAQYSGQVTINFTTPPQMVLHQTRERFLWKLKTKKGSL